MRTASKWGRGNERGCEVALLYIMATNRGWTSSQLARKTGYTPQHVNRTLKRMFYFGKCAYWIDESTRRERRIWGNIEYSEMTSEGFPWEKAMERLI